MSGGSTTQPMQAWVDPELKRATPGSPGIAWPHPHFCLGAPRQPGTGPGPTCEVAEAGGGGRLAAQTLCNSDGANVDKHRQGGGTENRHKL